MKVKELIQELQKYDQEIPVMVDGYEGGITEKGVLVKLVSVNRNKNKEDYYGEHEEDDKAQTPHDEAVLISREGIYENSH